MRYCIVTMLSKYLPTDDSSLCHVVFVRLLLFLFLGYFYAFLCKPDEGQVFFAISEFYLFILETEVDRETMSHLGQM